MRAGKFAHPEFDAYPPAIELYSWKKEIHPIGNDPEPKRRFIPSKWEAMKVMKIVKGIQEGRIVLNKKKEKKVTNYDMWENDGEANARDNGKGPMHIAAPKMQLPGHAESYRPPPEYLMSEDEKKKWCVGEG